ncbi:MAG: LysR family transcriptional regulator [Pseudomonadota bacterium]
MKTGLRRLHYFMTLCERLNFRRAAEDLGMTQPALSRAIVQLETELGVPLFERDTRRVVLTEAGAVFRQGCRDALAGLDGAVGRARKTALGEAGHLVIAYTDIAISGRFADIVQTFRKAYPDMSVALRQSFSEAQIDMLRAGDIDVGFMTGPVNQPDLEAELVQQDRFVAILPDGHRLAGKASVALSDLAEDPFVLGSEDNWRVYHDSLYRICREAGFEPYVVQDAPDTQSIIGLVACGMGVTVQTENMKARSDDRVHMLPIRNCETRVKTYAAWRPERSRLAARVFMEHVRDVCGAGVEPASDDSGRFAAG